MMREIEIYYLEMTAPADLRPSPARAAGFRVEQARIAAPDALQQKARSFRDDLHLFQEQVVKLLFAWQQSHNWA